MKKALFIFSGLLMILGTAASAQQQGPIYLNGKFILSMDTYNFRVRDAHCGNQDQFHSLSGNERKQITVCIKDGYARVGVKNMTLNSHEVWYTPRQGEDVSP